MKKLVEGVEDEGKVLYLALSPPYDEVSTIGNDSFSELQLTHTYKLQKRGDEWCAISEDGTKTLGCYPTEAQANERLRQVEAAKAAKE